MLNSSLDINIEQRSYKYLNLSKSNYNSGNFNNSNYRNNLSNDRLRFPTYNSRDFNAEKGTENEILTRHRSEWAISNDKEEKREENQGEGEGEGGEKRDEAEENSRTKTKAFNSDTKSETDEEYYSTDDTERMQLNPSTDFYDDEDDVYMDESSESFEMIPEAKKLIQEPTDDKSVDRPKNAEKQKEEEEDMGYDEDDERIAAERSNLQQHKTEKGYMNEEGSGSSGSGSSDQAKYNGYKSNHNDNRFSIAYLRKQHKKGQSSLMTGSRSGGHEVDTRESSGNFANDDDEDDDDDDDDDGGDGVEGDSSNEDNFFNAKHKPNNRYFRKNTNDAIKIISTPLGKVGIVYQQTPSQNEDAVKRTESNDKKPPTLLTDFDALSPDPDSSRLASSHPKITPVLTPDGKVALLYRGDSENTKYEPIRNLTHKFNTKNNSNNTFDSKESAISSNKQKTILSEKNGFDNTNRENSDNNNNNDDMTNFESTGGIPTAGRDSDSINTEDSTNLNNKHVSYSPNVNIAPTTGSFIVRPTDSVLPMINKPLSEVLGIKKNQFKQFRVKDVLSTTSTDSIPPRTLPGTTQNEQSTNLHFLTKVNLAEYPTSIRTRNRDFDFSQDNTMLDERNRHKSSQDQFQSSDMQNGKNIDDALNVDSLDSFTNEEMLSKTEVVDLAIIPHFDNELDRLNKYDADAGTNRRHHRNRQTIHRRRQNDEDLSGIHCIMQAMMGIAAISTVFGMLGTFFKQRILDQIRLMHW